MQSGHTRSAKSVFFYAHFYGRRYRPLLTELWVLLSRLAEIPPNYRLKCPLLEQHLDGDISNAYLAINLRSIKAAKTAD